MAHQTVPHTVHQLLLRHVMRSQPGFKCRVFILLLHIINSLLSYPEHVTTWHTDTPVHMAGFAPLHSLARAQEYCGKWTVLLVLAVATSSLTGWNYGYVRAPLHWV